MKNLILTAFVALAVAGMATAQDIDQLNQGTQNSQSSNQQGNLPVLTPPQGGTVKVEGKLSVRTGNDYVTRAEVEDHVRAGHKPTVVNNYYTNRYYTRPARRTTTASNGTARKEGNNMPQITIHNHIPAAAPATSTSVPKNPNMQGTAIIDPNLFPKGNGEMTMSLGGDGSMYLHRDSGSGMDLTWLWLLLGILAILGLVLGLVALVRGNGGGGHNHYHNYPPQPTPPAPQPVVYQPQPAPNNGGAAPAAPFVQPGPAVAGGGHGQGGPNGGGYDARYPHNPIPGWQDQQVTLVMAHPSGSPVQHSPAPAQPVNVTIHNHIPANPPQAEKPKPEPKKKTDPAEAK